MIEAMKMENEITAPVAGKVEELNVKEGAADRRRRRDRRNQERPDLCRAEISGSAKYRLRGA